MPTIADLGFVGLDDEAGDPAVITGYKKPRGKKLPPAKERVNQLIADEHNSLVDRTARRPGRDP
ncbi:hypothetical protein ACWD5R_34785 [Streptomyces sp. NPDC002514]|uniref:hypothetical protein n=1 Tax=Streptomyces sp. NPDC001270 TaxID=3364554 RepID=UPI00368711A4